MKLTIGMIVKNEEKWLEKCLTAIKPILDNVDCELIITDTGSTDRTVEIARKFTDKVLHFDWIGDFSAARNHGLKEAKGEWFMMLDADDIFCSCDHIIDFFNSGEFKNYNSASYISRNLFKTASGEITADEFNVLRMTKLYPDSQYVGVIHECINTTALPAKKLNDIADHYGYLYENDEAKQRKFKRNEQLLLYRFEQEKNTNVILYIHLHQTYMAVDDYENALKYLEQGIELGKKLHDYGLIVLGYFKIVFYYNEKRYADADNACDEYFENKKYVSSDVLTTDGEVYAIKAWAKYNLGDYSDAVGFYSAYFKLFDAIKDGSLFTYDANLVPLTLCTDNWYLSIINQFIDSCIKSGNFELADKHIQQCSVDSYASNISIISQYVRHELAVAEHFRNKDIQKYYEMQSDVGKRIFTDEILKLLSDYEKRDSALAVLSDIAKDDKKLSDKVEVYRKYYQNDDISENIRIYISEYGTAEDVDLIRIAMHKQYDISYVFTDDIDKKRLAYSCCKGLNDFYSAAEQYDVKYFSDNEKLPGLAEFYKYIMDTALLSDDDKHHIPELLKRFADCGRESESEILQAATLVRNSIHFHDNKKYKECISEIKRAINTYEPLGAVLSEYSKLVLNEYEKAAKAAQPQNEMQTLAVTIKKNIRAFIAAGNMDAARKTLNDYKQISPNDPDIVELMNELSRG